MKKKVLFWAIILFSFDQLTKLLFDNFLVLGKSYPIFSNFLYITKVYNDGISFSLLQGYRWIIILLSIIIMTFLYFYMRSFKYNKKNIIGFAMTFGGLFGNLVDRLIYGYVIDFIDFYIFKYNYPIFNFADAFICIGIAIILYSIYLGEDNENNSK